MIGIWAGGITLFAAAAVLAVFWLSRAVGARRLNAAADAYAEREIARTRREGGPKNPAPFRRARVNMQGHRFSPIRPPQLSTKGKEST